MPFMPQFAFKVPGTLAGKTISELFANDPKGLSEGHFTKALGGLGNDAPLQADQILNYNTDDPNYTGSGQFINLSKVFGAPTTQQQALLDKQKGEQSAFLGRYKTGLDETRTALNAELGLPGLREAAASAGQTARTVSRQVQDVAPTEQTVAKQVGISAPRLNQRIAAKTAELQPSAESARRALEDATASQHFGESEYTRRLGEFSQPYTLEASMLSESLAREFTGFTQNMSNELQERLQRIQQEGAKDLENIRAASALAARESEFEKQKSLLSLQGQQNISQEQQMRNLGLGSYYQKPSISGMSGW